MKTHILSLGLWLATVTLAYAQSSGKVIIRNASENYPTFIASLNGVRIENTYTNTISFNWLDDNVFRLKVYQYGMTKPIIFAVNSEASYVSKYMITKDETGAYRIKLESKALATVDDVVLQPPVTPANPPSATVTLVPAAPEKINDKDFGDMLAAIKKESFENSKLDLARNFFATQHHSTDQVQSVIKLFSFEKNKVAFAKFAYDKTLDKQNYFKVYDSFSFQNSKQELSEYIQKNP